MLNLEGVAFTTRVTASAIFLALSAGVLGKLISLWTFNGSRLADTRDAPTDSGSLAAKWAIILSVHCSIVSNSLLAMVSLFNTGGGVPLLEKCIHIYMVVWLWLSDCCGLGLRLGPVSGKVQCRSVLFFWR